MVFQLTERRENFFLSLNAGLSPRIPAQLPIIHTLNAQWQRQPSATVELYNGVSY